MSEIKIELKEMNKSNINLCWFVGAVWSNANMTEKFISEGYWENEWDDKFTNLVNEIQVGDKIAIKAPYTQKNNLPFDIKGETASVMSIKCIGTVTKNYQNGKRVDVEWNKDYKQKSWFFFTARTTIWKVERNPNDWMYGALLDFTFNDKVQDFNAFLSHSYWANKYKLKQNSEDEKYLELIVKYKVFFNKDKKVALDDELYKWELLTQNKEKKGIELVKAVSSSCNLIYQSDASTLKSLISKSPDEIVQVINPLLDESTDLIERLAVFKKDMKALVQKYLTSTNYAEDELTAADYLTYSYPEKYTFYTFANYKAFCKYLEIDTKKTGEIYPHYCKLLYKLESFISKDEELIEMIENNTGNYFQSDLLLAQNIVYVMLKEENFYKLNGDNSMSTKSKELIEYTELLRNKLNVILQGAPGTGKTYTTASLALSIFGEEINYEDRDAVMKRYRELHDEGRIEFCTFHQSMDYEDFIEGLKPQSDGSDKVTYDIEDGLFKRICKKALDDGNKDSDNFDESIERFIQKLDDEGKITIPTKTGKSFTVYLNQNGDGLVDEQPNYSRFYNFKQLYNVYQHKPGVPNRGHDNYRRAIIEYMQDPKNGIGLHSYDPTAQSSGKKPYVLIIDEINRGYVSKIFGELITLLEVDKRLGNPRTEIKLKLPYSKLDFGVPNNLYIIGTMNTTDRSTGTLDYAVRRRFAFVTLGADESVLEKENVCKEAITLFNDVKKFIENNKIEDIDIGDLMVGHSYFMTNEPEILKQKIKYEVIPLVKEYIKDGILTCLTSDAKPYFDNWLKLQTHDSDELEQ